MKFGVFDHLDHTGAPLDVYYDERLQLIEQFDRAGFYSYHVAEHHSTPLGMAPSPSVFLAAVARLTRSMRFGPMVYALPLYHPLRLVQEICMLDQMSRGRLDLGFGRGASPIELDYFGRDYEEAEPIYREFLDLIVMGLTEQRLDGKGKYYSFDDVPILMEPFQKPYPQMWYGAHATESAARAARRGEYMISLDTAAETRDFADSFRAAWRETHGDGGPDPLVGLGLFVTVGDTDAEALATARRAYPVWHASFTYLFRRHGHTPSHMRPPDFDTMAAEGRAIAGSPATVTEFLTEKMGESTANYLVGQFIYGDMTLDESTRSIRLFTDEVMPALSEPADIARVG